MDLLLLALVVETALVETVVCLYQAFQKTVNQCRVCLRLVFLTFLCLHKHPQRSFVDLMDNYLLDQHKYLKNFLFYPEDTRTLLLFRF